MFRKMTERIAMLAMVAVMLGVVGCESQPKNGDAESKIERTQTRQDASGDYTWHSPDGRPAPAPQAAPRPAPTPAPAGMVSTSVPFPTGVVPGSGLMVTKTAPREVVVNAPFDYTITAENLTNFTLHDVTITDEMPDNFKLISANPQASVSGNVATWKLGELAPRQSVTITIKGQANAAGELVNCAAGTYSLLACVTTQVIQPQLKITKTGPREVLICDPIQYTMVVENTGTGNATNVRVVDTLPAGITTTDGKQSVTVDLGTLASGQSRTVTINAKASRTGDLTNTAVASADGNLNAEAKVTTKVTQPVLEVTKEGPAQAKLGARDITYRMTVTNKGDGVARNVMASDGIPANTTFVSATEGGTLDGGSVVWRLGNLNPGQSKTFGLTIRATGKATVRNAVAASADCAESVTATAVTEVEGIPAILLEVVDENDPVAVGDNTTYVITVTNQGSATGRNIRIVAQMEDSMEFVNASGATNHKAEGRTITFEPLPQLNVGAKASWKVTIKATKAADARFTLIMNEDNLTRPVQETEATNFFDGG